MKLHTTPPEPLGCREWRAFFDPEGSQGFGKTENEAIRDLLLDVDSWEVDHEDSERIAAAFGHAGEVK
jgi:hypothetical protein